MLILQNQIYFLIQTIIVPTENWAYVSNAIIYGFYLEKNFAYKNYFLELWFFILQFERKLFWKITKTHLAAKKGEILCELAVDYPNIIMRRKC